MNERIGGRKARWAAVVCAGVVALGGGTLATTADASTTKAPGHTQSSQQAAKPKHCRRNSPTGGRGSPPTT
ncbi:hypothetical protein K378_04913 [Streptomyces sp. Amel2xB2]|nr:hypothetical protein K378_04913 [Streptomyces sp. Amel2xB2]